MSDNHDILEKNKNIFVNLVRGIQRKDADIEGLLAFLENSDFYESPASTIYHNNVEGGLCDHCINVYYQLVQILYSQYPSMLKEVVDENGNKKTILDFTECPVTHDSVAIVALFHDLSKVNYYETSFRNKKVYNEHGLKQDENGAFDWRTIKSYRVKDADDREMYGTHEETSEFLLRQYMPLTKEESIAILHHTGPVSGAAGYNFTPVYTNYKLAAWLHAADFLAAMTLESTYKYE